MPGKNKAKRKYILGRPIFPGEEWRKVPGFSDFEISSIGRLRDDTGLIRPHYTGRHTFNQLSNGDITIQATRARLVLLAFVGPPPEGKPLACHLNDDAADDRLENLAWGSSRDNYWDAVRNGRRDQKALAERAAKAGREHRGRIPITNDIEERRIRPDEVVPEGWRKGRSSDVVRTMQIGRWGR